ncbi:PilZ domain-containing protein [Hyphomonas sp.]|uniref:PilZ domain-containing protein n=1 Tax=Hyphomonas sp. TaxID=87 RepID=UPI00391CFDE1
MPAKSQGARKSARRKTWAPCRITWSPNGVADGVCIDVSETGAQIRFRQRITLRGRLLFTASSLNLNCACEVVRQEGYDASIRFLP